MAFTLTTERQCNILLVRLEGALTPRATTDLVEAIRDEIEPTERGLVMDLAEVTYLNSAGLRSILALTKFLQHRGIRFALCGLHGGVREVFWASGFTKFVTVHKNRAEAHDALIGEEIPEPRGTSRKTSASSQ